MASLLPAERAFTQNIVKPAACQRCCCKPRSFQRSDVEASVVEVSEWVSEQFLRHFITDKAVQCHFRCVFWKLWAAEEWLIEIRNCFKGITRRMYWQRASTQDGQAPGDATVLKRFFRDNFVMFRRRSKRIASLESVKFFYVSTYANFRNLVVLRQRVYA